MSKIKNIWRRVISWFKRPQDINPFYDKLYKLHNSGEYCVQPTLEEHLAFTLLKLSVYTTKWSLITDRDLNELRRLSNLVYWSKWYKFKSKRYKPRLNRDEVLQYLNCIDNGRFHQEVRRSVARKLTVYYSRGAPPP